MSATIHYGPTTDDLARIPVELTARPQWVCWRGVQEGERFKKLPWNPLLPAPGKAASPSDPATWGTFAQALSSLPPLLSSWGSWQEEGRGKERGGGIGYMFAGDDPYTGVDLDKCRDPDTGILAPWAAHLVRALHTYTEVSPSHTGVKLWLLGHIPHNRNLRPHLEVYDHGRFFTVTGQALPEAPETITQGQERLNAFYSVLPLLGRLLAQTGAARERFSLLFAGRWQEARNTHGAPYGSHSEADQAFANQLANTGASQEQAETLWRLSGLWREGKSAGYASGTFATARQPQRNGRAPKTPRGEGETPEEPSPPPESDQAAPDPLQRAKDGRPLDTILNVLHLLRTQDPWKGTLWTDSVRNRPMLDTAPVTEHDATTLAEWLGRTHDMRCRNLKLLDACLKAVCAEHPRDLLVEWLEQLPAWDEIPRLHDWLQTVAGAPPGKNCTTISRLLPLSLIARALEPGSLCRYVVILRGDEDTGKSTLLHDLVGEEWYIETSGALEGKEPHLLIQGAWLCELSELDSLTRTEENRLKSFLTMRKDSYVPKYSNTRVDIPRRTIFAGTTNDDTILKGQTGNTRFFILKTGTIDLPVLHEMRAQLFAEALHVYRATPATWWVIDADAMQEVKNEREERRVPSIYEDALSGWLSGKDRTTWEDIARHFLRLETPERWKDKPLQAEVVKALKALRWTRSPVYREGDKLQRYWLPPRNPD